MPCAPPPPGVGPHSAAKGRLRESGYVVSGLWPVERRRDEGVRRGSHGRRRSASRRPARRRPARGHGGVENAGEGRAARGARCAAGTRRPLRRGGRARRGRRERRGREPHHQDPARRADGPSERVGRERAHPARGVDPPRRRRDRGGRDGVRAGIARLPLRRTRRRLGRRRFHSARAVAVQRRGARRGGQRRPLPVAGRARDRAAVRPLLRARQRPGGGDGPGGPAGPGARRRPRGFVRAR